MDDDAHISFFILNNQNINTQYEHIHIKNNESLALVNNMIKIQSYHQHLEEIDAEEMLL